MRADRLVHPRLARWYLVAIGSIAMALLVLFAVSIGRERKEIQALSKTNLRLEGERLAVELERRTWEMAEECLRDPVLREIALDLAKNSNQGDLGKFRPAFHELGTRHRIAEHFFILTNGQILYPSLEPTQRPFEVNENVNPSVISDRKFAALFAKAERAYIEDGAARAIPLYLQCSELPVADKLKAIALRRLASCYVVAKLPTRAVNTFHRLEDRFGDLYDEFHVPFALVAALELDHLRTVPDSTAQDHLQRLYQDLINGRWQLSASDTEEYRNLLKEHLAPHAPEEKDTAYLRSFRLARVLQNTILSLETNPDPQRSRTKIIKDGNSVGQLFWIQLSDQALSRAILAFTVDTGWFTGALLNESKGNSKDSSARISAFQIAPANDSAARDLTVPFRTVFPNLALYLPEAATKETKAAVRLEMFLLGGSGVLMACLLCLISVLLARISKDLRISQLRADFLGGVSHELRTPLTLILLYTETLLSDPDLPAEDRRKSCEVISREGQRLSHLISNLLHLSRLKRTAQDYRIAEGDLAAVVRKTSAVCSEWLGLHGFTVRTDLAASLPQVRFDPERVSEALMNIVDNARKYSGESRMVDIRLWGEAGRVILEVQDYGIGVPPNEQERVFEQFYRASNATEQSGSGLGLFLASDVMRAHNGSIELESEIMRGSRIRLVFPASGTISEAGIGALDHSAFPALHRRSWSQVPLARIGFEGTAAHGSTRKFGARIS